MQLGLKGLLVWVFFFPYLQLFGLNETKGTNKTGPGCRANLNHSRDFFWMQTIKSWGGWVKGVEGGEVGVRVFYLSINQKGFPGWWLQCCVGVCETIRLIV